jgi:cell division control protein 24
VLEQANAAVDRELRGEAMEELIHLVEDWKNHEISQFGELLLYGQFTVLTGKSDVEKEVSNVVHYLLLVSSCIQELSFIVL